MAYALVTGNVKETERTIENRTFYQAERLA